MAENPTNSRAKPDEARALRFKPLDVLADAAIAWLRRYLPKNFGVDLEPQARDSRSRREQAKRS